MGFSEGAEMSGYMQLAKLNYSLGGVIIGDGYPLPPLVDMVGHPRKEAIKNASYAGDDMRFMIWEGAKDYVMPVNQTLMEYTGIFEALNITNVWKINHTEPGLGHFTNRREFG